MKKIIFFVIVIALIATAFIEVDCPICEGKGSIEGSHNMGLVRVLRVEDRIIDSVEDACSGYIVTKARPVIYLNNLGTDKAIGWLKVDLLMHGDTNKPLATQYLKIELEGETSSTVQSLVVFAYYTGDLPNNDLSLRVSPMTGGITDTSCNGSGKVAMNKFWLTKHFKEDIAYEIQEQETLEPDMTHGGEGSYEWLVWMELA